MPQKYSFTIDDNESCERIDKFLTKKLPALSRSFIQHLIKKSCITKENTPLKPSYKLEKNDTISITIPEPTPLELTPQNIPLDIIYEDHDIVIVNKPPNLVVHPGAGNYDSTLVNALLYHVQSLSGINGTLRPGIVHRLDKHTSGCLVVAKTDAAHKHLSHQFKTREIYKEYLAIVEKPFKKNTGVIESFIKRHNIHRKKMSIHQHQGKTAVTEYTVIENFNAFSLVKLIPKTGRTHQIRVHLSSLHHPIIGDHTYNGHKSYTDFKVNRYILHAFRLHFSHPITKKTVKFKADLPEDMKTILRLLGTKNDLSKI